MTDIIIPRGYDPIAKSELLHTTGEAYYNRDVAKVFFVIENRAFGPFTRGELEAAMHVANDVSYLLKGRW